MGDRTVRKGNRNLAGGAFAAALLLLLFGQAFLIAEAARAQTSEAPRVAYQSGTVTAVRGDAIGINGKDYKLMADATILDQKDQPVEASVIKVAYDVKFHLNRAGKIDRLIVILPR